MQRRQDRQESDVRRATRLSLTSLATSAETLMEAPGAAREEPCRGGHLRFNSDLVSLNYF
jgi:hypothetical protein